MNDRPHYTRTDWLHQGDRFYRTGESWLPASFCDGVWKHLKVRCPSLRPSRSLPSASKPVHRSRGSRTTQIIAADSVSAVLLQAY